MQIQGLFPDYRTQSLERLVRKNREYWMNGRWSLIAFYVFFCFGLAFFIIAGARINIQPPYFTPNIFQDLSPLQLALGVGLLASILAHFAYLIKKNRIFGRDFLKLALSSRPWQSLFLFFGCGVLIGWLDAALPFNGDVLGKNINFVFIGFAALGLVFFIGKCLLTRVAYPESFTRVIVVSTFTFFILLLFFLTGWYMLAWSCFLIRGYDMFGAADCLLLLSSIILFIAPIMLELSAFIILFGAFLALFVYLIPVYLIAVVSIYTVAMIGLFIVEKKLKRS